MCQASGNNQWNDGYPLASDFQKDVDNNQLWIAVVRLNRDGEYVEDIAGVAAITTDQPEEYGQCGMDISETCIVAHRLAANAAYHG